jgi:hypothetical protein
MKKATERMENAKLRLFKKEEHEMEGFLCIQNGKTLKVKMKGKTLSSVQGKIVIKNGTFHLPMLPLGLKLPIVFPIGLQNIGNHSLKYVLDKKKFINEYSSDYQSGILDFENTEGTLMAGEKKFLSLLYRPIRDINVKYKLQIRVNDYFKEIQVLDLELIGKAGSIEGSDTTKFFKVDDLIETDKTVLAESDRIAYFSEELLDFRDIEFGRTHKRILFLYNNSSKDKFEFKFMHYQTTRYSN